VIVGDTPNIRFKGFMRDWEQRKLGELAEKTYGGGTPKTSQEGFWNGNIPWFQSADLTEHEVQSAIPKKGITEIGLQKSAAQLIPGNSIAIVTRVGVGKLVFMPFSYATSQDFLSLSELNYDEIFVCYAIYKLLQKEKNLTQGTSIKGITKEELLNKKIEVPNREEQKKIGRYFTNLDHLITLHQRKCDETKELKKYMLQKMFPQNCQKVPELRFAGFTEDWEQRKFGDLGSVATCKRIFKDQTESEGDIPFYKIGTFGSQPDAFISRELFEEYRAKFQYPEIGDMLISASGTIGRTVEYNGENAYFQDSNIVWFKHDERIDNSFLKCIYTIVKWSGVEGSTIKRLYNDNFLKTEFYMPTVLEQKKIGVYFQNLDHLITLHQRKCNALKEVKKFMLQNMFP